MFRARKAWLALLTSGIIAVLAGGAMVARLWHHTIGLGVLGLGVLLVIIGEGFSLKVRMKAKVKIDAAEPFSSKSVNRKRVLRLAVVVALIAVVALASFDYASYVASLIGKGAQPTLSLHVDSSTEVAYPNGTIAVHLAVGATGGSLPYAFSAQWEDGVIQTSPVGNFTRSFQTGQGILTGVTITATSTGPGIGSLLLTLPSQAISNSPEVGPSAVRTGSITVSTQPGPTPGNSKTASTGIIFGTTSSLTLATQSSSVTSQASSASTTTPCQSAGGSGSFTIRGTPKVTMSGGDATLSVLFVNNLCSNVTVNVNATVSNSGGVVISKYLLARGATLGANAGLGLSVPLGTFSPGTYTLAFYVVDLQSNDQMSATTTIQFTST
jgi:hypothetical protein